MSAEEVLDVVDAEDRVVGQAPRSVVHGEGLTHRAVLVLVRAPGGRIFVHRRTERRGLGTADRPARGSARLSARPR